jgi:hypothetical protein
MKAQIRLAITLLASIGYMVVAVIAPGVAVFLVPAYCFFVVVPEGIHQCRKAWYAQPNHDRRLHPRV